MNLVVDANILFSAILSRDGLVAETFREAPAAFTLIAPAYITDELIRLRPKMAKSSRLTLVEVEVLQHWALAQVKLISEEVILHRHWAKAAELAAMVDPDDIPYIALALMNKCQIWTGDTKLRDGLAAKGFKKVLYTAEVRRLIALA